MNSANNLIIGGGMWGDMPLMACMAQEAGGLAGNILSFVTV